MGVRVYLSVCKRISLCLCSSQFFCCWHHFGKMGGVHVDTKVLLKEMLRAIWIHTVVSWHQPELTKNHCTAAQTLLIENTPRKQLGTAAV